MEINKMLLFPENIVSKFEWEADKEVNFLESGQGSPGVTMLFCGIPR